MSENLLSTRKPYLSITPSSGWASLRLAELWEFRDLMVSLATRDIKIRYKQTVLGVVWVILQTLLSALIFTIVFGQVAKFDDGKLPYPYFVFSYCGQLAWIAFSSTLTKSSTCLIQNSQLISKVFFPRLVLPLSTVVSTLVDFAIGTLMLGVIMVIYRVPVGPQLLFMPVWLALLLMLGVGVGLIASALTVSYRDIQYILPVAISMLVFASPVGYSTSHAPAKYQLFFLLNPLSALLDGFRSALLPQSDYPTLPAMAYAMSVTLVIFIFGLFSFKRMERRFADVI